MSEAYFMDFKFEPGNYYLAARRSSKATKRTAHRVYPTRLFNETDDEKHQGR